MPVLRLDVVPPLVPSCRIPHNIEGLGRRPACQKRSCWKFLKFHHDVRIRSQLAGCRTRATVEAGIGLAWTCLKFRELDRSIYNLKQMFGALPVFVQILYWHGTSFNSALRNQPKLAIRPSYLSWRRKSHIKAAFSRGTWFVITKDGEARGVVEEPIPESIIRATGKIH